MENQYLKNIKKGMKVEILTDNNRISRGIIEDIISRASYQLYGIRVRLVTGEIGKVQKIISSLHSDAMDELPDDIRKLIKKGALSIIDPIKDANAARKVVNRIKKTETPFDRKVAKEIAPIETTSGNAL